MDEFDELIPSVNTFQALQSASCKQLLELSSNEIRIILPTLMRTYSCKNLDDSNKFVSYKKHILRKIRELDEANFIAALLKIDFKMIQEDVIKEQCLRNKVDGTKYNESAMLGKVSSKNLSSEFEKNDALKRTRIILSEILRIKTELTQCKEFKSDCSEIFQCAVFQEEISDILCIALAELPFLIPITEMAEVLLRVKYGPLILCNILANNPDYFEIVCSSILSHTSSTEEMDFETQVRIKTLKMLCQMDPSYSRDLRAEGVALCKLAPLVIQLSIQTKHNAGNSDIVPFFSGLLLASDSKTKEWIADYIKAAQREHKENALMFFKRQLLSETNYVIDALHEVYNETDKGKPDGDKYNTIKNHMMHGIAIMRLFCALKSTSGFKLTHDEVHILINLITCPTPPTQIGARFITVALCTLVGSAFLFSTPEREEKILTWLRHLINEARSVYDEDISYGEILLLIAIHFHANTLEPIVDLISTTLGIKMKLSSLTKIKVLFTQEVFPEKVVAEHALTVAVTKGLNKHANGFLPAHCIHQLMKSRVFTKHHISVKSWLFKQLCSCTTPVHPLMLQLIETYINAIINSINISKTKHQRLNSLQPFNEEEIICIFTNDDEKFECLDKTTSQILLMLYVLTYQNGILTNMKSLYNNPKAPRQYTTNLFSKIPMKQLLLHTRGDELNYGELYPPLLKLITILYPHLCLVEDWIEEEEGETTFLNTGLSEECKSAVRLSDLDVEAMLLRPHKFIIQLTRFSFLQSNVLVNFMNIVVDLLPHMLNDKTPRKMQILVSSIWSKINTVNPDSLWLKTVNMLRQRQSDETAFWDDIPEYTNEEIKKDPLIVLRCDRKVYRCPPIFELVLRVLNGYLTASRALLNHHLLANPLIPNSKSQQELIISQQEREELKKALISAQESAAIQILLEVCLPTQIEKEDRSYEKQCVLREIQCKVCCFIHQSFISAPNMIKLIHFQGYPPELLSITVSGVPSMHICLDFIPELLNQPHLEKQLFAIQLASHLALQYPIPKSYSICKYIIDRLNNLLMTLPAVKRNQLFVPSLKCLVRISKAFPPLRVETTEVVFKICKIAVSQLDKCSLLLTASSADSAIKKEIEIDEAVKMEFDDCKTETKVFLIDNNTPVDDNPAYDNKNRFLKTYTTKELVKESELMFEQITKLSVLDNLVVVEET